MMKSPLYSAFGGDAPPGGPAQLVRQFEEFRRNFKGDPKAEFMRLVQSGQISQQQLNQLQSAAMQFQNLIGKR